MPDSIGFLKAGRQSLLLRHRFSAAKKSFKISHFQNRRILAVEHPGGAPVGIFYHFLAAASREKSPPIGGENGRVLADFLTGSSLHHTDPPQARSSPRRARLADNWPCSGTAVPGGTGEHAFPC